MKKKFLNRLTVATVILTTSICFAGCDNIFEKMTQETETQSVETNEEVNQIVENPVDFEIDTIHVKAIFDGVEPSDEEDFDYNDTGDGIIIQKYKGTESTVVIPETINGEPVIAIEDFSYHIDTSRNKAVNIKVPKTVKTIKTNGFETRPNSPIDTIYIEEGLETIEDFAFYDCTATNIILPQTVKSIGNFAFSNCFNLKDFSIPDNVKVLGQEAFSGCTSLENIRLSDNLKTIGPDAFNKCKNLKSITIPSGVEQIKEGTGLRKDDEGNDTVFYTFPVNYEDVFTVKVKSASKAESICNEFKNKSGESGFSDYANLEIETY